MTVPQVLDNVLAPAPMHLIYRLRTFAQLRWWGTQQLRLPRGKAQSKRSAALPDWEVSKQVKKTCSEVQNTVKSNVALIPFPSPDRDASQMVKAR